VTAHATGDIENRVRAIEDRLEIYNLIAAHPISADSAAGEFIAACWVEDGLFDRGELSKVQGRTAIAQEVFTPNHQAAIAGGIGHFASLPHVQISGDNAVVTSYLQIIVPETRGEPLDVPGHGAARGFHQHRVSVNRWEFVRTDKGWQIKQRFARAIGTDGAQKLLVRAFERVEA